MYPMVAPYEVFPTRDGELMVAAGNDRIFLALCGALDAPELVEDERFRTNADRVRNRDALAALLTTRLTTRPSIRELINGWDSLHHRGARANRDVRERRTTRNRSPCTT